MNPILREFLYEQLPLVLLALILGVVSRYLQYGYILR